MGASLLAEVPELDWWPPEPQMVAWTSNAGAYRLLEAWGDAGGQLYLAHNATEALETLRAQASLFVTDPPGWSSLRAGIGDPSTMPSQHRPLVLVLGSGPGLNGVDATCPIYARCDVFLETVRRLLLPRFGLRLPRIRRHDGDHTLVINEPTPAGLGLLLSL